MEYKGLFKSVSGNKKSGSETRKRRALARAIVAGDPIDPQSYYAKEILNLRQFAEDCVAVEDLEVFFFEGKAIDAIFKYSNVDGFLIPSEASEFYGAWLFLKDRWGF